MSKRQPKPAGCRVRMPHLDESPTVLNPQYEWECGRNPLPMMSFKDDLNRDRYRAWLKRKRPVTNP